MNELKANDNIWLVCSTADSLAEKGGADWIEKHPNTCWIIAALLTAWWLKTALEKKNG